MSEDRQDGQLVPYGADLDHDEKCTAAVKLRRAGHSWNTVVDQLGYANVQTAMVEVRRYLHAAAVAQSDEDRAQALALEVERLDELQAAYWDTALSGDIKAAEYVLKVIGQRSRLRGLEEIHKSGDTGGTRTVVIAGTSEQYVQALKELAGES